MKMKTLLSINLILITLCTALLVSSCQLFTDEEPSNLIPVRVEVYYANSGNAPSWTKGIIRVLKIASDTKDIIKQDLYAEDARIYLEEGVYIFHSLELYDAQGNLVGEDTGLEHGKEHFTVSGGEWEELGVLVE